MNKSKKIMFFVSEDWYFCSHRIDLAKAAIKEGYHVSLVTRIDQHSEQIQQAGIELLPINIDRSKLNIISDIKLIINLIRIYRKHKPDIVHHVAVKPVIYGSIAAVFSQNKNVINALGGLGFVFSSKNIKAKLLKPVIQVAFKFLLSRKCNKLIVQNNDDYKMFNENFSINSQNIYLIKGAGVDNNFYKVLPEPKGTIKATLLARMLVDKGVNEFVEAAKILKAKGSKIEFELIGDPDPLNPASVAPATINNWVRKGYVQWKGFESNINKVWANSHISVLPSYREGMPKSLLESAACGRAIITTNVPGCREIVTDGVNGLLVPVKDPVALASAIEKLANDKILRDKFVKAGRRKIDEELSSDKIHEQTLNLYREILSQ